MLTSTCTLLVGINTMDRDRYLDRIGIDPSAVGQPDLETLEKLQRAHVTTIPFETLSITGDPYGSHTGSDISLAPVDLYKKLVARRRGGFCYELNGLFGWLLDELGFEVRRLAARIKTNGSFGPPADHLTLLVSLKQEFVVDVGLGLPKLRHPLSLDGSTYEDTTGIAWRVSEIDRPDADFAVEYRQPDSDEWETRCIVRDIQREMSYFEATCGYFQYAPDSAFRGEPVVTLASDRGHLKLSPSKLTRSIGAEIEEKPVSEDEWYRLLDEMFGISYPPSSDDQRSFRSQSDRQEATQ